MDGDITTSHFLKMTSGLYKQTNNDLNESLVKEEREYVMLNACKLNNSCKSGNKSLVNKYIDLNIDIMVSYINNKCTYSTYLYTHISTFNNYHSIYIHST
jgi:hypothetical protein